MPASEGRSHVARGRLIFAASLSILPFMDALAKLLSTRLPVLEIIWARFVVYALLIVPIALARHGLRRLLPRHPGWQLVRGSCMALSSWSFFAAVARMPVADTMAIFMVYPTVLLCLSLLLLRERPTRRQWWLVALGFLGALLVIRPSFNGIADGVPFALASAGLYALGLITTRKLAGEHSPMVTTAISAAIGAIGFSCAVPSAWQTPSAHDVGLLVAVGVIATIGHYGIVAAHRWARPAQLAPLGYIEIAGAVIAGAFLFQALPVAATWAGIVLIVASGIAAARSTEA